MTHHGLGRADVARCWAGFASLGAGLVHLAVVREHLDHWLLASAFFAVVGALQLGWGLAALARDDVPVPRLVTAASLGVVALWAVSRTTGLPAGPGAGAPEAVGRADVLCVVLQLVVVGSVLAAGRRRAAPGSSAPPRPPADHSARPRPAADRSERPRPAAARGLVGLALGAVVMAALTTPALAATGAGEHARPHFQHGQPQHTAR